MEMTKVEALRIVTRCTSREQFVAMFRRFCTETACFIPSGDTRPVGTQTSFSIRLADGTPILKGRGVVLDAWTTSEGPFRRPGVQLGIERIADDTRALYNELVADRSAAVRIPPGLQLRMLNQTVQQPPIAIETPTIEMPPLPLPEEPRIPGSEVILPANPLTEMSDDLLSEFVECNLTSDTSGGLPVLDTSAALEPTLVAPAPAEPAHAIAPPAPAIATDSAPIAVAPVPALATSSLPNDIAPSVAAGAPASAADSTASIGAVATPAIGSGVDSPALGPMTIAMRASTAPIDVPPPADSPVVITDGVPTTSSEQPTVPNPSMKRPAAIEPTRATHDTIPQPLDGKPHGRDIIATLLGMPPLAAPKSTATPTPVMDATDRVVTSHAALGAAPSTAAASSTPSLAFASAPVLSPSAAPAFSPASVGAPISGSLRSSIPTMVVTTRPSALRRIARDVRRWWIPATVTATVVTAAISWFAM